MDIQIRSLKKLTVGFNCLGASISFIGFDSFPQNLTLISI